MTLAHVARARVLAGSLDPGVWDVHVAWDPRYNALLGSLPFAHHPIDTLPTTLFLERLGKGAPMHDVETLRGYVRADLAAIDRVKPDVVVGDFRLSLAASARIAKVPHIAVANAYWSPYGRQTFQFPEYDYPLSTVLGHRVALSLFNAVLRPVGFAAHTKPLNVVLREHGLDRISGDIRSMYCAGDYTAYADLPDLVPLDKLPSSHSYIGPVLWSPEVPLPAWWNDVRADRPVVYATPGSSGELDFLPRVLEALGPLPVSVIAATAGRGRLPRLPANANVADFLPGQLAAQRASIVICNGGSPTTYQALTSGVPVLGIAGTNMDQHLNMEAVRRVGAGDVLRARGVSAPQIRTAVERVLGTPSFRINAKRLAEGHHSWRAEQRFSQLLDRVLGHGTRS